MIVLFPCNCTFLSGREAVQVFIVCFFVCRFLCAGFYCLIFCVQVSMCRCLLFVFSCRCLLFGFFFCAGVYCLGFFCAGFYWFFVCRFLLFVFSWRCLLFVFIYSVVYDIYIVLIQISRQGNIRHPQVRGQDRVMSDILR